jgi:AcrR family transcriptional regulator
MKIERSGGGDPERTLALLWRGAGRAGGKPARGRKPKLTPDQIVRAAITVADREGLTAMSMVRVAEELGAGTMSLYTHVPGKAELIDLMVDSVLLERELTGAMGDWRERIGRYGEQTRAAYRRHPWLRQVSTVRPPLGPGLLAQQECLLSALSGIGLSARQMAAATAAIVTFVDAAAAIEVENAHVEHVTGETGDAWWAARESFWQTYFDEQAYPAMARVWNDGGFADEAAEATLHAYEFGLRQLLNGIQATIEANARSGIVPS